MQHKINIQPSDDVTTPPPVFQDRSNLSNLYAQSAMVTKDELASAQKKVGASGKRKSIKRLLLVAIAMVLMAAVASVILLGLRVSI